jgi:hypothetical protein
MGSEALGVAAEDPGTLARCVPCLNRSLAPLDGDVEREDRRTEETPRARPVDP